MKIKNGFVAQKIGEKTIVVSTGVLCKEFHGMIELNATAADIWNWVEQGLDEEVIVEKYAKEYEIDEEKARLDVNKIIGRMESAGVFEGR